jgi:hypothetical protein
MATTTHYAAIDATDPVSGAVYGVGETETGAARDAGAEGAPLRIVSCTPAAAAHVRQNGGAPDPRLTVTGRGVCLRSEEE